MAGKAQTATQLHPSGGEGCQAEGTVAEASVTEAEVAGAASLREAVAETGAGVLEVVGIRFRIEAAQRCFAGESDSHE